MYLYCYPSTFHHVLSELGIESDPINVSEGDLANSFVKLESKDGIKVLEEILQNQQLISDETERLDIDNYETSKLRSRMSAVTPHHVDLEPFDPPREKKESGLWRRQLTEYLRKDGFYYNEQSRKLEWEVRTESDVSIVNPKPALENSFKPELKEYYHVRVRIDRGSGKYEDLHRFNLDELMLKKVVRNYDEEGLNGFDFEGRKIYPSDRFALTIYCTWFDKVKITGLTDNGVLWTHIEKKGNDVTTDYIKIPGNPWKDFLLVCSRGHILNSSYKMRPERNSDNCPHCGGRALSECPKCGKPLPGDLYKPYFQSIGMHPPSYCTECTFKFPWTTREKNHTVGSDINSASLWLQNTFSRLHAIIKTFENRPRGKNTWKINDEYDLQYLVRALLHARFNDIREEEHTPSFGVLTNRMDFIIKEEGIVIETKMTRDRLDDKELLEQLMKDTMIYQGHPDCKTLFFVVYDPEERIMKPHALQRDLEMRNSGNLKVRLIITPLNR
jgi:hypothetical protein